jgi:hypothetical protein
MAKTSIQDTVLWLSPKIYQELLYYARNVDAEVGGLGYLTFDTENNDITVEEVYLLEQEVHSSECELSAEGCAKLIEERILAGEDNKLGGINFWWHSHHTMGAFFSVTDDTTMKEWVGPYIVALVINQKGEMKAALLTRTPIMIAGEVDVKIDWSTPKEIAVELDKAIEDKVTVVKFVSPAYQKPAVVVPKASSTAPTPYTPVKAYDDMYGYYPYGYGDFGGYSGKSIHDMTDEEFKKAMEGEDDSPTLDVIVSSEKTKELAAYWNKESWD